MEGCGDRRSGAHRRVPRSRKTHGCTARISSRADEETEDLQSICKIGTGFSDEDLNALSESLRGTVIDAPKSYFKYGDFKPDVWFDPSQVEVKAADLPCPPRTRRRRARGPEQGHRAAFPAISSAARGCRRWRWRRRWQVADFCPRALKQDNLIDDEDGL